MGEGFFQNVDDVLIVQGIVDAFSFPAGLHLVGHPQQFQLMTDRGLGHSQRGGYIADTEFAMGKCVDDLHAGLITQHFEKFGNGAELFFFQHLLLYFFYDDGIVIQNRGGAFRFPVRVFGCVFFYCHCFNLPVLFICVHCNLISIISHYLT